MYSDEEKEYCLISQEVLFLLEWLLMQDIKILEKLVKKSWEGGLDSIFKKKNKNREIIDQVSSQKIVFYFFSFLDNTLKKLENKKSQKKKNTNKKKLLSVLSQSKNSSASIDLLLNKTTLTENNSELILTNNKKKSFKKENEVIKEIYKAFLENWNTKKIIAE